MQEWEPCGENYFKENILFLKIMKVSSLYKGDDT
jgi:hypothetical protein